MKSSGLVFLLAGLLVLCTTVPSASGHHERPGVCPFFPAVVKPPCVKECSTDGDCRPPLKCCSMMCSMVCLRPNRH